MAEPCRGAFCKLRSFRRGRQGHEQTQHTVTKINLMTELLGKALGMAFRLHCLYRIFDQKLAKGKAGKGSATCYAALAGKGER